MTLVNGNTYLAIPGPSVMPERVLRAMHRAAPNIYRGELHDLTEAVARDLKSVARTKANMAIYICNGHGVWEASLANVVSRGDKVLVLATGRFGHGWAEMAEGLRTDVEVMDFGEVAPVDPAKVEARLRADTKGEIRAVMVCHVDTSSSVRNDIPAIRAAMDAAGHDALLMADCIASLGCERFEMDAWGVDVMISASQKGLMTPPGLGFVWFNEKADKWRETADCATAHWDWRPRSNPLVYYQYFNGTAPTHHMYGLRAALDMIGEEGLDAIWDRHATLAQTIWAAVDAWGQGGAMRLNVTDPAFRSHSVTSIGLESPDALRLQTWCEEQAGLTLGIGLGRTPEDAWFRIGHMGHVNAQMIMAVLGTIDAGLKALGIAHGSGALEAAATVIAKASSAVSSGSVKGAGQCCS